MKPTSVGKAPASSGIQLTSVGLSWKPFHSFADDRWAVVRHLGALSLAVPRCAATTEVDTFVTKCAAFRLASATRGLNLTFRSALAGRPLVSAPALEDGLVIPIGAVVGTDPSWLKKELTFSDAYLAGVGAVGNGFVYAFTTLRVPGVLTLLDPDTVSGGNLNRACGSPKQTRLQTRFRAQFPRQTA